MLQKLILVMLLSAISLLSQGKKMETKNLEFTQTSDKNVHYTKLENGMQVVIIEDHRLPVVSHMVWYKVGSADEEIGKTGLAHLLEHLMFKGTNNVPEGEFSTFVYSIGGVENAFTSWDYTAYYQIASKDFLAKLMKYESDRMQNVALTPEIVATELKVVQEERAQRTDNSPQGRYYEAYNAKFWKVYPYRNPIIGWPSDLEKLSYDNVIEFYKKWYTPSNAILILSGDITPSEVTPLILDTYAKLNNSYYPKRNRPTEPEHFGETIFVHKDPQVKQPMLLSSIIAPSYITDKDNIDEVHALEVLVEILNGVKGDLITEVVNKQKLASNAYYRYDPTSIGPSNIELIAIPTQEVGHQQLMDTISTTIKKWVDRKITQEEVSKAIDRLLTREIYAKQEFDGRGEIFGQALAIGETVEDVNSWQKDLQKINAEIVNKVFSKYFKEQKQGFMTGALIAKE